MSGSKSVPVERVGECRYEIPRHGAMNVPGLVFADERLMADIRKDQALAQVANVACLPGIVRGDSPRRSRAVGACRRPWPCCAGLRRVVAR